MAAASKDSDGGLFRNRNLHSAVSCRIAFDGPDQLKQSSSYISFDTDSWDREVDRSPLNDRAWVLQEHLLAPRSLYFAKSQLFWECQTTRACETLPCGFPKDYYYTKRELHNTCRNKTRRDLSGVDGCWLVWRAVLQSYPCTKLTIPGDRLIAIGTLAREIHEAYPDEYLAGL